LSAFWHGGPSTALRVKSRALTKSIDEVSSF
jgi:hypothetical protein